MNFFYANYHSQAYKIESVPSSSGTFDKFFCSKNFRPCEDIQLYQSHVHILQDSLQGINKTSATFLQKMVDQYNSMDVNNCKRTLKFSESRWGLIQRECTIYNRYYLNMKAQNESDTMEEDIQQKAQVMYKESQKDNFR